MKPTHILILLLAFTACNTTTDDNSGNNNQTTGMYRRAYDAFKGGVQIVAVQVDQNNAKNDEWVVLQTDRPNGVRGWYLDAGDAGQHYTLYSHIIDSLVIYTHADLDPSNLRDTGLFLSSGKFIWNNDEDTCRLFNSAGSPVDEFTYKK
jgi:hypothetical protein